MKAPALLFAAVLLAIAPGRALAQTPGDWPSHDRDAGGQRFSPLKQITPANVATLQVAWTFDTGANGVGSTPLVVGGVMYLTAGNDVVALTPETGTRRLEVHRAGRRQPARRRVLARGQDGGAAASSSARARR